MVGTGARGMVGVALRRHARRRRLRRAARRVPRALRRRACCATRASSPTCCRCSTRSSAQAFAGASSPTRSTRFTVPVVAGLGLASRAAVVICGDTTAHAKPHPAPLLEAARRLRRAAADCVYVGDDLRDVQAGRAAGMPTARRRLGLPRRRRADRRLGGRHRPRNPCCALEAGWDWPKLRVLGPTWFRRGCGSGTGHAEHQFARKSTGNKVTANDQTFRPRRLKPVSLATVGRWAGSEAQPKAERSFTSAGSEPGHSA